MKPHAIVIAALFSSALTLGARQAEAGKVIVLAVQGDRDGELEDGLSAIVEDRHDLVTSQQVERAARKSHIDELDGPSLGKLARKLGADAVVDGSMTREDDGYLFVVRIRASSGKTIKKISVDLPKRKLSAKAKKRLGTGILDGIDKVLGIESDERIADDGDDEDDGDDDVESRHHARSAARDLADEDRDDDADRDDDRGDRDDRVASRDEDDGEELDMDVRRHADRDDRGGKTPSGVPAVVLSVGPSATMRTLAFTSRDYAQAPLGYKSSMVPGARISAEIYPLAIKGDGPAAGLGIGAEYDQTLQLTTRSSDAPDVGLPTTEKHWMVDARYRFKVAGSTMLTLIGGYGRRTFIVDRGALPAGAKLDMPDVDYRFFDPGAAIRMPIGGRLALHASGQALLVRAAGFIQRTDSYGGAKLTGIDARAGMELKVGKKLVADVSGSFTTIGYVFVGNGQETNNRDLDPTTQDVGGASDQYIGVVGTLGYTY